jgi:hypothetical protein
MNQNKTITICSSAAFYKHVNEIADELEAKGFKVIVPESATKMRKSGNYDVMSHKTWYENPNDFTRKRELMDGHFAEVANGDVLLVVNDEKHGVPGYIGPNVLMEMAIGYYLKKPLYVLYDVSKDSNVYEEVIGMGCHILSGDLGKISL